MHSRSLPLATLFAALPLMANAAPLTATERERIDAVFKEHSQPTKPGCAVGVARDGAPLYTSGYGMADLERAVPITANTLFDIASVSKQFTAAAILLLVQDGKIALTDDVRKYVPELPDFGTTITIDHMLRHTSGLRDYIALMLIGGHSFDEVTTQAQALEMLSRQRRLNFPTGSRHEYSNSGYILSAEIVRRVTGESLAAFAHKRIFTPLGMREARFVDDMSAVVPNRALGHAPDGNGGYKLRRSNWQQIGDGSLHVSMTEALHWMANFERPQVGGAKLIEQLEERGTLSNGERITYARGLFVDDYRGLPRIEHGGDTVGFHSMMVRFPQQHVGIAVFCNADGIDVTALTDAVTDIVIGDAFPQPKPTKVTAAAASPALPSERFTGRYFSADVNAVYEISQKGDTLVVTLGRTSLPLQAAGPTTFSVDGYPVTVAFEVDGEQPAHAMRLEIGSSLRIPARRFAPATPSPNELRVYQGVYYSPELDVSWPLSVKDGVLSLDTDASMVEPIGGPLDPAMADSFSGAAGFIQFKRDASKHVNGFALSASRMRDLEFVLRDPLPSVPDKPAQSAKAQALETVTRDIWLEPGVEAVSIESFTGAITLKQGSRVSGNVVTDYGELRLERGAEIGGNLENESGAISLAAARVRGRITTTAGDIEIGPDSHVDGGILVRQRDVIGLSFGSFKLGFPIGRERPRVVIGPGATVNGTLRFKRAVELYVSERATIGAVEGATPIRFVGERPAE